MKRAPSTQTLLGFRAFYELADQYGYWKTSVGDYVDFLAARRRSVLTSQWTADQRRLTVSVNLMGIRLDTAEDGAVPGVAIPAQHLGGEVERMEVDDETMDHSELATNGRGDELIVELPPGRHVLSVYYSPPSSDGGS